MASKKTTFINPDLLRNNDQIRAIEGRWSVAPRGIKFLGPDREAPTRAAIFKVTDPLPLIGTARDVLDESFNQYSNLLDTHIQTITLVDSERTSNLKGTTANKAFRGWKNYVNDLLDITDSDPVGPKYEYYVDSFKTPITKEEALNIEGEILGIQAAVDYVYNFNMSAYERVLENVKLHEVIPELYSKFDDSVLLGTEPVTDDTDINVLQTPTVKELRKNIRNSSERIKFQNKIVPIENMPILAEYEGSKHLFPMYADIRIPLEKENEFAKIMRESTMGLALTRDIEGVPDFSPNIKSSQINFSTSFIAADTGVEEFLDTVVPVRVIPDLLKWVSEDAPSYAYDPDTTYPVPENFSFIGTESGHFKGFGDYNSVATATADNNAFLLSLLGCLDGLKTLANDKRQNFEDLLNGKKSYSEMLMYRVEKRLGPAQPELQDPIQTFHFMNSAEVQEFLAAEDEFKFVDTQVKYDTEYIYTVSGYRVVVGTQYRYQNPVFFEPNPVSAYPDNNSARVDVISIPILKLIEVPIFVSSGRILDNPPLQPEVRFFPVVGDRNKIKMFFATSTGQEDTLPITFNQDEADAMAQVAINQNSNDGTVTFKTDDPASAFEIYRMSTPPVQIRDFSRALFATVPTTSSGRVTLDGSSATATITQAPNQKFYYIFRTVDTHGHKSNPSPVYEIELYNDGGAGYPIIRHYDMTSPDPTTTTKSARKIIQIVPRISQAYLNETASGLRDDTGSLSSAKNKDIVLGTESESLFGKKFKVRLTSKSTGKKLDLNINFKTKQLKSS